MKENMTQPGLNRNDLGRIIEEETYRFSWAMAEIAGLPRHQEPYLDWAGARAFRLRFAADGFEAQWRDALHKTTLGRIPRDWVTGPSMTPPDLPSRMLAGGFTTVVNWSGMAVDLQTAPLPPESRPGVEIATLQSGERLWEWAEVVTRYLFQQDASRIDAVHDSFARVLGAENVVFYAAHCENRLAGTSLLFLDGNIAGLHVIAVRPEFRNRGIGRLLTLAPLREASHRGCVMAVLQASPAGEPVYRKLGFEEYCRMAVFRFEGNGN